MERSQYVGWYYEEGPMCGEDIAATMKQQVCFSHDAAQCPAEHRQATLALNQCVLHSLVGHDEVGEIWILPFARQCYYLWCGDVLVRQLADVHVLYLYRIRNVHIGEKVFQILGVAIDQNNKNKVVSHCAICCNRVVADG